ncbi:MAG: hypothetical protein LC808_06240 [Actinobacteria bacterium]|nr:hypothetical protein [Actinomycetota bacterium]
MMDAYSRLIVGWSIAEHMRTELVADALGMAIIRRQPDKQPGTLGVRLDCAARRSVVSPIE